MIRLLAISAFAAALLACAGMGAADEAAPPADATEGTAAGTEAEPVTAPGSAPAVATTQASAATTPNAHAPTAGLPDLTVGIDKGGCETPGNEGARAYFVSDLKVTGSVVSGSETWLIYANDKLKRAKIWQKDGGGEECMVRWMLTGVTTTPSACGACDTAVQIKGTVDVSGSTCPEGIWKREREWTETYDIARRSDGTALFYFHRSGKQFGQGYHSGDKMNFITDPTCQWF
jgi:hypothetical protein